MMAVKRRQECLGDKFENEHFFSATCSSSHHVFLLSKFASPSFTIDIMCRVSMAVDVSFQVAVELW